MRFEIGTPGASAAVLLVFLATTGCEGRKTGAESLAANATVDSRTPVVLPAEGRQAVLYEMRQMLAAVGGAMAAASKGDTAALLAAVAPASSAAAADPALESVLPMAWKALAERTHSGFDSLAAAVRRNPGGPGLRDTVLVRIAGLIGSCTGCHETFRVTLR